MHVLDVWSSDRLLMLLLTSVSFLWQTRNYPQHPPLCVPFYKLYCQCCHDNQPRSAAVTLTVEEPPTDSKMNRSWAEMGPGPGSASVPACKTQHICGYEYAERRTSEQHFCDCKHNLCDKWHKICHSSTTGAAPPTPLPPFLLRDDNQPVKRAAAAYSAALLCRGRLCSLNTDTAHWKLHVNLPFLKTATVALSPLCNLQDSRLDV